MELQFKYKNDVILNVNIADKRAYAWSNIMHGEIERHFALDYESDDDLIELMKRASDIVNLEQHRDIVNCTFDFYTGINHCSFDGYKDGVMTWSCDNPEEIGLKDALKDTGAVVSELDEWGYGGLFTSVVVENNGTRIAKIIF